MNKKAQVWIETVIYTLIAFSLIAAVLAFVKPAIDKAQDRAIIEQSIGMMKEIDLTIGGIIQGVEGNKRILELSIREGSLDIDGVDDSIMFGMDSKVEYSEVNQTILEGNLLIRTDKKGSDYFIAIKRDYSAENVSIMYNSDNILKSLTKAGTSYKLSIANRGKNQITGKLDIDVAVV